MKEEKNCPCCPNHCDVDHLSCGRGKEYFGSNKDQTGSLPTHLFVKEENMTLEEKAINKIRQCGHYLHHEAKTANLNFLQEEEINDLIETLSKCLEHWK